MYVKQLSVFIENTPGCLADFTRLLGQNDIDLVSLSIADTTHFGILRCITADYQRTAQVISQAGYTVHITDVLAVSLPDQPGGLAFILDLMAQEQIAVEYLYSFVRNAGQNALIIFKVNELEKATQLLESHQVKLLTQDEVRIL